jgi:hypothetical protein
MIKEVLLGLGLTGIIVLFCLIALIPLICTIILGTYFATTIGLEGITWWAFVIIFYLIIVGILGALT